jgi:hypothetical protein
LVPKVMDIFLLPMNEVNMKVVISKFFFIDFLDELGLFIGEKTVSTKKKISVALP